MRPGVRRVLQLGVSFAVLALAIAYARHIDWHETWSALARANVPLLFVVLSAHLVSAFAKAVLWWMFLRALGITSFSLALRATIVAMGLNSVLTGNAGEAARVVMVTRESGRSSADVLATVALERMFEAGGWVIVLAAAAMLLPIPEAVARWRNAALGAILLTGTLIALLMRSRPPASEAGALRSNWVGRALDYGAEFIRGVRVALSGPRLAIALALTVVNWGGQVAAYHLAAIAAHLPITVVGSITTMLTANVGFLVRATPGNMGIFQVVYAATAEAMGLPRDTAMAAGLLLQFVQNLPLLVAALVLTPSIFRRRPTEA